jgi:hypothetical protein
MHAPFCLQFALTALFVGLYKLPSSWIHICEFFLFQLGDFTPFLLMGIKECALGLHFVAE